MPHIQTVQRASTRYKVRWSERGNRRSRNFATADEAAAFAASLPPASRRGATGRLPIADRIGRRVTIDASGCWLWQGNVSNEGYGLITVQSEGGAKPRTLSVHRLSYEEFEGPIPSGLVIDHLCRTRRCANPLHLEAVTQRENVMRSPVAPGALNAAKTHCPQGHPYDEANTYIYRGKGYTGRICKTCRSEYSRRYYLARKATS